MTKAFAESVGGTAYSSDKMPDEEVFDVLASAYIDSTDFSRKTFSPALKRHATSLRNGSSQYKSATEIPDEELNRATWALLTELSPAFDAILHTVVDENDGKSLALQMAAILGPDWIAAHPDSIASKVTNQSAASQDLDAIKSRYAAAIEAGTIAELKK